MTSLGPIGTDSSAMTAAEGESRRNLPVLSSKDQFYQSLSTDYTWINSYKLCCNPSSVISGHLMTFELPRLSPGNFLCLNDLGIQLMLRLESKDGQKPKDDALVAPVNLVTAAMFRSCRIFVQEVEVSSSSADCYALNAYTQTLLTNSFTSKNASLQQYGYYPVNMQSNQTP